MPVKSILQSHEEIPTRELRHLSFRRFMAHPLLRPWVQCYWSATLNKQLDQPKIEKLYPDGCTSLMFTLSTSPQEILQSNSTFEINKASFCGTHSLQTMTFEKPCESFGVRLYPGSAFRLLAIPVSELGGETFDASDFGLPGYRQLQEELAQSRSVLERVTLLDNWLLAQAYRLQPNRGPVQEVWKKLQSKKSNLNSILSDVPSSRRTFERRFFSETGLSPGQLRGLLRIKNSRQLIRSNPHTSLTQIAQECGYYDQAHFSRQFHALVRETPGEYRQRQAQRIRQGELAPN